MPRLPRLCQLRCLSALPMLCFLSQKVSGAAQQQRKPLAAHSTIIRAQAAGYCILHILIIFFLLFIFVVFVQFFLSISSRTCPEEAPSDT